MAFKLSGLPVRSGYIFTMVIAAGLSLIRGFFVARFLDLPSFGIYTTVVATGMFSSSLVSFGETERTLKSFPRLWVMHHCDEVVRRTDQSFKRMLFRTVVVVSILVLANIFMDDLKHLAKTGLLVMLVAISVAVSNLYASAIRATGAVNILANNSFFRAFIVITLGVLGAFLYNWQGAILGEVLGTLLGIVITRHSLVRQSNLTDQISMVVSDNSNVQIQSEGGVWLFFSALLISAPTFLDRAFVASTFGSKTVGTFGFLMLFVMGASTFTGIIAQKVGPQLVKMEHLGSSVAVQVKYALRWLILIWSVYPLGLTVVTLAMFFGPGRYFFDKFHLDLNLLAATVSLCMLQVSVIADFIIISRNKEQAVFFSACCYLLVIGCMAAIVYWSKPPLADFIWLLAFCKGIHVVAQSGVICKLWYREKRQCGGAR